MKCPQCERETSSLFCSIECACYSGYYHIKTGWIKDPSILKLSLEEQEDFVDILMNPKKPTKKLKELMSPCPND